MATPRLPVPNTVRIQLKGDHEGDPRITTMDYRHGGANDPVSTADLLAMAQQWYDFVFPKLRACVCNTTGWDRIVATDLGRLHGNQATLNFPARVLGLVASPVAPGDDNVAIAKITDAHARGETGRTFVMDLAESDIVDANIGASLQFRLAELAVAMLLHLSSGSWPTSPVVASLLHGVFHTILATRFDLITDHLITRLKNHRRHKRRRVPA
jgi:hypothetical protein